MVKRKHLFCWIKGSDGLRMEWFIGGGFMLLVLVSLIGGGRGGRGRIRSRGILECIEDSEDIEKLDEMEGGIQLHKYCTVVHENPAIR
jgi:hypothetical protein